MKFQRILVSSMAYLYFSAVLEIDSLEFVNQFQLARKNVIRKTGTVLLNIRVYWGLIFSETLNLRYNFLYTNSGLCQLSNYFIGIL